MADWAPFQTEMHIQRKNSLCPIKLHSHLRNGPSSAPRQCYIPGVTAADPSGIFGSIKEAAAGMHAMIASLQAGGPSGLLGSLLADKSVPSLPDFKSMLGEGDKAKQMSNLKTAVLGKIRGTLEIPKQKASPEEVTSCTRPCSRRWPTMRRTRQRKADSSASAALA